MKWNKGFTLGLIYLVLGVVLAGLTDQPPDGPLAWLGKLRYVLMIVPMFAASHGYNVGFRDAHQVPRK
jgi:hypothetical protein